MIIEGRAWMLVCVRKTTLAERRPFSYSTATRSREMLVRIHRTRKQRRRTISELELIAKLNEKHSAHRKTNTFES
jgi:hypothetical protein